MRVGLHRVEPAIDRAERAQALRDGATSSRVHVKRLAAAAFASCALRRVAHHGIGRASALAVVA